jgi:hypothetical protein
MKMNFPPIRKYIFSRKIMEAWDFKFEKNEKAEFNQSEKYLRYLTLQDLPKLERLLKIQRKQETVFMPSFNIEEAAERLRRGESCVIWEENEEIIGYNWYVLNKKFIHEISATLILKPDEVYSYNGYVNPSQRGKNILPNIVRFGDIELKKSGVRRKIAIIMGWNDSVKKVAHKTGWNYIGNCSVSFFMTLRFFKNDCRDVTLVDEGGKLEFYRRLSDRMK